MKATTSSYSICRDSRWPNDDLVDSQNTSILQQCSCSLKSLKCLGSVKFSVFIVKVQLKWGHTFTVGMQTPLRVRSHKNTQRSFINSNLWFCILKKVLDRLQMQSSPVYNRNYIKSPLGTSKSIPKAEKTWSEKVLCFSPPCISFFFWAICKYI